MAVDLRMNVPVTLEFEFPDAFITSGRYGDRAMFTLTNGEKFFCDPFLANKIKAAGIGAYCPFNLTKREIKEGNHRRVEYEIEILKEPQTVSDPRPTVHASTKFDGKVTAVVMGAGASLNPPPAAVNMVDVAARSLGVAGPVAVPSPSPAPSSVALMKVAAIGAIDVVLEAEAYARSRGMVDFAFDPGSIQDLVTTLFIEMNKRGGRA